MNRIDKNQSAQTESRSNWFVGASYGGTEDQTPRFLREGIWENGYKEKYADLVHQMRPGDRIAIKSSYTRKHNLPFDNRGETVSVMAIKATGTITENLSDGRRIRVDWIKERTEQEKPREWYFYTHQRTVWRVSPGEWKSDGLLAFTFEGRPQDIDRFRNAPYWHERYGDSEKQRFRWTKFYEAIAEKLFYFKDDRTPLIEGIHEIASRVSNLSYLDDKFTDSREPLQDICPFTAMGTFNRGMTLNNRRAIASEMEKLLKVGVPVPDSFEGIPVLNPLKAIFFKYPNKRQNGDVDALWNVFVAAGRFVSEDSDRSSLRERFAKAYDDAMKVSGVSWNLSMGLYWAYPWHFPTLDSQSRKYIMEQLEIDISKKLSAEDYLTLLEDLKTCFSEESCPVHSFPELSLASYNYSRPDLTKDKGTGGESDVLASYSVADILTDGCFHEQDEIERYYDRLLSKKNLILQGPPGTGKTWLAKRLAFALIGGKDTSKIRAVQFHPNLSYEDFVRGWRPAGDGKLSLIDGVFMEAIRDSLKDPSLKFVVVIEEINRGNPTQIFGELLTLLEAGKRTPEEAIELCYPDPDGNQWPVYVPENLYVIGTMNTADRSIALVDFALRRRFAFVNLEPQFGNAWRTWVVERCGVDSGLVRDIEHRLMELNRQIIEDPRLGKQFLIGHSYVTPPCHLEKDATRDWFMQVAETEIGPLLEEYWFDSPKAAKEAVGQLIKGW